MTCVRSRLVRMKAILPPGPQTAPRSHSSRFGGSCLTSSSRTPMELTFVNSQVARARTFIPVVRRWFTNSLNTTHFAQAIESTNPGPKENRVVGERTDDFMDLATIRPDGTDLRRVTRGGGYTYESFWPGDRFILYRRQRGELSQVFLMKSDGSEDHNLSGAFIADGRPSWSPDGQKILFSRRL